MKTALYVHIPFCETKCGYCDFYSVPLANRQSGRLVRAVITELLRREPAVGQPLHTIFAGGGTPTLLPLDDLEYLFSRLAGVARRDRVAEFTTEANPATVSEATIQVLSQCGVDRISFGGQSFHKEELQVLERLHDPHDICSSVQLAREGGIPGINLDLMFGIPGQTLESWRESLHRAVDLGVEHLSCYGLTYEPHTPLHASLQRGSITPCENDLEADMYSMCVDYLRQCGFRQYEISNFCRPGCECRHNLIYWNNWPYLGVGPSASSYLAGARFKNIPNIDSYVRDIESDRPAWREEERLGGVQLAGEIAMLQLRLNRGIDIADFEERVGVDPRALYRRQIADRVAEGLLQCTPEHIRLTDRGRLRADAIIRDLLVAEPPRRRPRA